MGKYNVCLDVGGTKVLGAIFDENQQIIYRLKKKSKAGENNTAVVTFKKKGKVTITCTAKRGKKKAKIKFNVSK